jgi:hypothetical protein
MNTPNTNATPIGLENLSGKVVGRDPRRMTPAELATLGHSKQPSLAVIRAKCLDCCAGEASEVRKCVAISCSHWPYRMGTNPFARRELSEEDRQARRERVAAARANRSTVPA